MEFKIKSMNVWGLAADAKQREVFRYLSMKSANIFFIQESHSCKSKEQIWHSQWERKIIFVHGLTNARGAAIFICRELDVKIICTTKDPKGRWILTKIMFQNIEIILGNIYVPNDDQPSFFAQINEGIEMLDCPLRIYRGDFNMVLNVDIDKRGSSDQKRNSRECCYNIWKTSLCDIWQQNNAKCFQLTRSRGVWMCRIDYFTISEGLLGYVEKCDIEPG